MMINGLDGKQIEVEDTEAICKSLKEIVVCHISQKKNNVTVTQRYFFIQKYEDICVLAVQYTQNLTVEI